MRHNDDLLSLLCQVHKLLLLICHVETNTMFKDLERRFLMLANIRISAVLMAGEACKFRQLNCSCLGDWPGDKERGMLRPTSQMPGMGSVSAERGKPARPEHLVCCWVGQMAAPVSGFPHEPSGLPRSAAGCLHQGALWDFVSDILKVPIMSDFE